MINATKPELKELNSEDAATINGGTIGCGLFLHTTPLSPNSTLVDVRGCKKNHIPILPCELLLFRGIDYGNDKVIDFYGVFTKSRIRIGRFLRRHGYKLGRRILRRRS